MHCFIATILCLCLSFTITAQDLPVHPHVRTATLENGITYYIWPDGRGERTSLRLLVPIGSVLEKEHEQGIAHLVEHLMFRGTHSYTQHQISEFLNSIDAAMGPDANAFTGFDRTVYQLEVPIDNADALFTALNLMRGWISEALLEHRDIEAERSIVLEEWRLGIGQGKALYEEAFTAMLEGSRYAERLPIGVPEIIETASPQVIRNFWHRWYKAAPAAIVITGPVDPDLAQELIEETFGQLPGHRNWEGIPIYPAPLQKGLSVRLISNPRFRDTSMTLSVLRPSYPVETIHDYRRSLLETIYTQMLYRRLRATCHRTQLHEATCYTARMVRAIDVHLVIADCAPDELSAATSALIETVQEAQNNGLDEKEFFALIQRHLDWLEKQAKWGWVPNSHDLADLCLAHFMDRSALLDGRTEYELARECLKDITLSEFNKFTKTLSINTGSVLCITTNIPEAVIPPGLAQAAKSAPRHQRNGDEIAEFSGPLMPIPRHSGALERTGYRASLDMTSWKLANGMRVHLMHRADVKDMTFHGIAAGGLAELPPSKWMAGRLASRLLNASGIRSDSPDDLEPFCEIGADLDRMLTPLTRHIRGYGNRWNPEELMQLIHLGFSAQDFDQIDFEKVRSDWIQKLTQETIDPIAALNALSRAATTQNHPLFASPLPEEVRAVTFEDVATVAYTAFANPADFELFFVGNLDPDEFEKLVGLYLATLSATNPWDLPQRALKLAFPDHVIVDGLALGSEPLSFVQLTFPVTLKTPTPHSLAAANIATAVVRDRLHELLRGRLSATYYVDASLNFLFPDMQTGQLTIMFSCDPEDTDVLALVALRELRRLKTQGPYEDEIQGALTLAMRRARNESKTSFYYSRECARYTELGWDLEQLAHPLELLYAVGLNAVHNALKEMLPLDRYTLMMSFPEQRN